MRTTSYLRDLDLAERYKTSRATIWRWAADGHLPRPIRLSPGCTRWRLSDIESWEAARAGEPAGEAV